MAPSIAIRGAAQLLRPPADGLPYLRHDRAAELTLAPGDLTLRAGAIAALADDGGDADVAIDARGCAVLPGFVDAHTHLPFADWRAREYEQKVTGVGYEQIAREGGGIRSSARAFARANDDAVLDQARALAAEMLAWGTTAFECKSGYGLSRAAELRALRLAAALGDAVPQQTVSTALLAHALPDGFDADGWLDVVAELVPEALAQSPGVRALDVYVESIAFTNDHLRRVGALAARHGLDLRCHVEQFATHRSVPVALELGARSVDHLACIDPADVAPLAAAECAAVLLPGAEFLGDEHVAPARALIDAGAIVVVATDANPGTSPVVALPIVLGLAVRRYGLTAREALLAATLNAAWTIGRSAELGSIEAGKRADLIVLDGPVEQLAYRFGHNPVAAVICGGELVHVRPDCAWRIVA
ncbi:imidazolonepropionase [Conexibacter woesei]|uniref:Imidazolonepropionase n=1 Tax=Conexibacter woesei (strain DSM 14684 / CCUG 47730 / CIP 108061 / JCM 11494 / NBRC 100937 / ID131577) TaxID=469383 RepID=D3F194_CONWI|nr:imidazolonepropionase [Conexibacter woesei]ADB52057.1 imidazolonepropionase [Conexibacter woesei DSM 14684]